MKVRNWSSTQKKKKKSMKPKKSGMLLSTKYYKTLVSKGGAVSL